MVALDKIGNSIKTENDKTKNVLVNKNQTGLIKLGYTVETVIYNTVGYLNYV